MLKINIFPKLSVFLLISTLLLVTCKSPIEPENNPDLVKANIFTLDKEIVEGIQATFAIKITYPMYVKSIVVSFNENRMNDTTINCKTKTELPETLIVKFTYPKDTATQTVSAVIKLTNDKIKEAKFVFMVRKKDSEVSFVTIPKPHLAAVNQPDTLLFIAKINRPEKDIFFKALSVPSLDDSNLVLITKKDTALLIVIPKVTNLYTIMCYAKYGYASDSANTFITAYEKPLLKTSSGNGTQIVGTTDTLHFTLPSSSSGFQFTLLDSGSYDPGVLSAITNASDKKSYLFTPNKVDTFSFSFLVKKDSLTDTITYQRMVIEKQKPVWNKESEKIAAVEGKEIIFPFGFFLTDTLKKTSITASKGTITGYSLQYLVPYGSATTDTVLINANNNGVISPFNLFLNITPSDSIAPKIIRVKPESDTINTDKLTCEFKITDLGAGVGNVKFERDAKIITDTAHTDSIYKCTVGDLKHGDTIKVKVTATDKSMRKNSDSTFLKIFVIKSDTAKTITDFGFNKPLAKGVIDKSTKKILVTVPFGTDVRSLAAAFTTTGASVQVASKEQKSDSTVNDFTNPVKYTVIAVDKSTAEYEVTVVVASPGKNADLNSLTVSAGSLTPTFSANIANYTVNVANSVESLTVIGTLADTNATINYVPSQKVKLSIGDTTITVNVTAQDSTVKKKYEIKVKRAANSNANLLSLTVSQGVLTPAFSSDSTKYTVNVANSVDSITVNGTSADPNATIKYTPSKDVKLSDKENIINVEVTAQDKATKKKYEINVIRSVSTSKEITSFGFDKPIKVTGIIDSAKKTISVTVPNKTDVTALKAIFTTTGKTVKVGTNVQKSGETANNFKDSVIYTVVAANDSTQNYVVKVTVAQDTSKELTSFGFDKPKVDGKFDKDKKTITVTVPYETDVKALVAKFTTTGKTVKIDTKVQKSGETVNNFKDSVIYTVVAANDSTQNYVVKVTVAQDTSKELTSFSFDSLKANVVIEKGKKTITVTVPYKTNVKALVAKFTTTGKTVKIGDIDQVSGKTKNDFSKEVTYKVIAEDKSSTEYKVKVIESEPSKNANLSKLTVSPGSLSSTFSENTTNYTVNVANSVESLTVTATLADSNASLSYKPSQKIKLTVGDNNIITVEVTAQDGKAKKSYEIKVTRAKSSVKEIIEFGFVDPNVKGEIDPSKKTVSVIVPFQTNVTKLVAIFEISGASVKVDSKVQESGKTVNDFSKPVTYTVFAENGDKQDYVVTVYRTPAYEYTVNFNGQGATNEPNPATKKVKEPDTTVDNLPTEPKKTNYRFGGWFTKKNGEGTAFTAATKVTSDTTVYANWIRVYKVTYDGNGSTGGDVPVDSKEYKHTETVIAQSPNLLVKEGHSFVNWNTKSNGEGALHEANKPFNMYNMDIILYAIWVPHSTYKVTFDAKGGDVVSEQIVASGTNLTEPSSSKKGYVLEGWFTSDNKTWDFKKDKVTSSFTLTAKWVIKDNDGNTYTDTLIGEQVWMVENFRCTTYNNGEEIPLVSNASGWSTLIAGGCCFYKYTNDPNDKKYWGALYNWHAVNTKKLAPKGWHVPTDDDWKVLEEYLIKDGKNYDGTKKDNKIAKAMSAKADWNTSSDVDGSPGKGLTMNNSSGFSALPGGYFVRTENGKFDGRKDLGYWWTSTENDNDNDKAWSRALYYDKVNLESTTGSKHSAFSVRLIKGD